MALKREDVAESRKWDLSSLFASEKEYDDLYVGVAEKLKEISAYEGKLDEDNALACLRLSSEIGRALERLYVYANLIKDENTADPVAQARAEKIGILAAKCSSATSFISAELAKFPAKTLRRMAEKADLALSTYDSLTEAQRTYGYISVTEEGYPEPTGELLASYSTDLPPLVGGGQQG